MPGPYRFMGDADVALRLDRHYPRRRVIQYAAAPVMRSKFLRDTGYSAFAEYDDQYQFYNGAFIVFARPAS